MSDPAIALLGYRFSVYTRIVRLVLAEKGLRYDYTEIDPFLPELPCGYEDLHPFGRVPVLVHDGFTLYETAAIARYLDKRFPDPALTPDTPEAVARMQQVIGIVDSYGYRALVRQVFSHLVFRPLQGAASSADEVSQGLRESRRVLRSLETIAREGLVLDGETPSLADFHLAPMIDYFIRPQEGAAILQDHPAMAAWWDRVSIRPSVRETRPDLSQVPGG